MIEPVHAARASQSGCRWASRAGRSRALANWLVVAGVVETFLLPLALSTASRDRPRGRVGGPCVPRDRLMPRWRFRVHRWEATATAVYTQSGWLNQERRIAPVARIQTVDTQRGPFERVFGLANVA